MKNLIGLTLLIIALASCQQATSQSGQKGNPARSIWKPYSKQAVEDSIVQKKPVVIDFYADWCPDCHELDRIVFSDPSIIAQLAQVTALRMNVTNINGARVQSIIQEYGIDGVPEVVFLDGHGHEIKDSRVMGLVTPEEFSRSLKAALKFTVPPKEAVMQDTHLEKATFAGGCFWCMQPFFDHTIGVKKTTVGYTGGTTKNPTYEEVSSGTTGHVEAIQIEFDPREVSYEKILNIYWHNIDPTQVNGQFVDEGSQYRTVIFYHNEEQKRLAERSKQALAASGRFHGPIATQIVPASTFYPAEDYHQKYYQKSPFQYDLYHDNSGRNQYLEKTWGKDTP